MAHETELKFIDADFSSLRKCLAGLGAKSLGRHVERNMVFDTPERTLRQAHTLLRLRSQQWKDRQATLLTLKCPPSAPVPQDVKVYDERETAVDDFNAMRSVLEGLGYGVAFLYEKLREEWRLPGVEICLDTMPFGHVVELEGERDAILACARQLGLSMDKASRATYHELNRQWRLAEGLAPDESFCFPPQRLHELIKGL
ncbi:class IV adenylate cyclase [Desulfovibrio psychrotolerans]|uniref:Adenylate cyclase n=1 Tax=Desulfovibrio psychrotolerans TaxID=415242 RepID=A0A7J0BXH1_9BACT|nr:class IV adenylate cyclase [Desulfovibrio psychrotolerans]GFM38400.1 adenylate cyclase [Desulfovibrio psychrotolerans]